MLITMGMTMSPSRTRAEGVREHDFHTEPMIRAADFSSERMPGKLPCGRLGERS